MTDITELAQREKFEAWFVNDVVGADVNFPAFKDGEYTEGEIYDEQLYFMLQAMWMAWKAAGAEMGEALEKAQQTEKTLESRNRRLDGIITAAEKHIADLESRAVTVENLQESAYRAGLTAGWNLGLANNNEGFNKCLAAHAAGIKVNFEGEQNTQPLSEAERAGPQERRKAERDTEPYGFTDGDRRGMIYKPEHADRLSEPVPLYRHAQPAPEYPETLPCPVLLEPGLRFSKGIKTSTMLAALARRAVHESDMAALSPEERVEFQARIEDFKALIAQPAPVVPDKMTAIVKDEAEYVEGWNACRAAMLAAAQQEVKGE